ncbi:S1 family peptidase [Haloplanus rubicundus]|uniref:Serine protease n=1 Tax=Haloplanus rubicundus TaxID=1547898 RepID=A0A345EE51_9EURY|nr:serine protease [Haloplanus rubicundus]AXG10473.1 serine protease [Haloplanus rubicundus]
MVRDTQLLKYTTLIKYELGSVKYSATGCFVRNSANEDYLITNKHVISHEHGISPEYFRIFVRKTGVNSEREFFDLSLNEGSHRPLTHPECEEADVAAVPLGINLDEYGSVPIHQDEVVPEDTDAVLAGGDAIVIGYPNELKEESTYNPIIRRALVSTPYGQEFNDEPCFLMDARMHVGMSGSPVFTSPAGHYLSPEGEVVVWKDDDSREVVPSLLGIHSGPVDRSSNLGLHRVWYPSVLFDIVNQ